MTAIIFIETYTDTAGRVRRKLVDEHSEVHVFERDEDAATFWRANFGRMPVAVKIGPGRWHAAGDPGPGRQL